MDARQIKTRDLPIRPANPSSPIPLYHQVEISLREFIEDGKLAAGDILPPEIELSRAYDVGRHTMRMALARLVDDGLINRKAGRGTVVMQQSDRVQFFLDRSFTSQMADMNRTARSKVIRAFTDVMKERLPWLPGIAEGTRYFSLTRLRYGDEEPIGLQQSTIIAELCPGIERFDFDRESLYEVLSREYKLVIHTITHSVSATLADQSKAKLLQIKEKDPLLIIKTTAYLENGQIIEATISHYRADRYEYHTSDRYTPC